MPEQFIYFITYTAALFIFAFLTGGWLMGRDLRKRFKYLKQAIENSNEIYMDWRDSEPGSAWQQGYRAGVSTTLSTLQAFIDKAVPRDDTP